MVQLYKRMLILAPSRCKPLHCNILQFSGGHLAQRGEMAVNGMCKVAHTGMNTGGRFPERRRVDNVDTA